MLMPPLSILYALSYGAPYFKVFSDVWAAATCNIVTTLMTMQHNLNLNTSVGLDTKMTLQTQPHHHPKETQQYPSGASDYHLLTTTKYDQ